MKAMAILSVVAVCAMLPTAPQAPAEHEGPPASIRILSPGPDDYASGRLPIRVEVQPTDAARDVVFYVDGREVCTARQRPFECDWDSGATVVQHQIRVVANLAAGGRVVTSTHTKALDFAESVAVDVVQITATVGDEGHFVKGLPKEAFHVFEDGTPQAITHFESEDVPLELTVAIDISSSMTPAMPKLKAAVKELLADVPANAHVTLLAFNDALYTLASPASDRSGAEQAVDALAAGGYTALYDVVLRGADLAQGETGRKAMIVFTDGEDQGSHATLADVRRRLEATDMTLYMIGQGRGTAFQNLKKLMTELAEPTGGRALFTDHIDALHEAFTTLLDELSNQYLLGYAPTNAAHDGTLRTIKLDVDGHRHVRARQSYRAPLDRKH